MPELRQNIITREWVIIAKERAMRPHEFVRAKAHAAPLPAHDPHCPFCTGNEAMTVGETYREECDGGWKVRVVTNKFPALSSEGDRVRNIDGVFRSMTGVGFHEVVIEHPRHDLSPARYTPEELRRVLTAFRARYTTLKNDPRIEAIIIFKNHGESAGTSLQHPHSQIAATPIVPTQIRHRLDEAIRFFDETGLCVFCTTLGYEVNQRQRIIQESDSFVAFIPYAALSPFHLWIFPKRHESSFDEISDDETADLAVMLQAILAKIHYGLNDPDYNFSIRSIPAHEGHREYFHWYVTIIPRIARTAGFEIGSGMYINVALPEESAEFLRNVKLP
ncbi:MAG TPA: galactose-1-phosphate uridylyltransferase [Bacteroidota bacterium]|nr:galactose-1-phosphate uridylyltransferase [Bacteroidota bacterium]